MTKRTLLRNGQIVDGSGSPGFKGHLLLEDEKISALLAGAGDALEGLDVTTLDEVIDCDGMVVAPGFIDLHSHNDWFLTSPDRVDFERPFAAQGITTFVGGNCGFGIAAFAPGTRHKELIRDNLFRAGGASLSWESLAEYWEAVREAGPQHNLALFAGHGTTRASLRGHDDSPLSADELDQLLRLLEEAMDQGALGVSLGLQYEPGIFATPEELEAVARLVARKGKLLSVHSRALSALSPVYPIRPFGTPHNVIALEEMLDLARRTGVRLQYSHLIFVGQRSWSSVEESLKLIDRALAQGVDVRFDTYAHSCGASVINVLLPAWVLAGMPGVLDDRRARLRLRLELGLMERLLGFGFDDIQIAHAIDEGLAHVNGRFVGDIARQQATSKFDTIVEIVRASGGTARVLMHRYSTPAIVEELMRHSASLFMTDAWVEPEGLQNPGAFGCFPRFLQTVREKRTITLEEAIHKMTGANAERVGLERRGLLREGFAADVVLFDAEGIADNTTATATDAPPAGIEGVWINGKRVLTAGEVDDSAATGEMLPASG